MGRHALPVLALSACMLPLAGCFSTSGLGDGIRPPPGCGDGDVFARAWYEPAIDLERLQDPFEAHGYRWTGDANASVFIPPGANATRLRGHFWTVEDANRTQLAVRADKTLPDGPERAERAIRAATRILEDALGPDGPTRTQWQPARAVPCL